MKNKQYCPHCRKFTETILDRDDGEAICKKCAKRHKVFIFSNLLIGR